MTMLKRRSRAIHQIVPSSLVRNRNILKQSMYIPVIFKILFQHLIASTQKTFQQCTNFRHAGVTWSEGKVIDTLWAMHGMFCSFLLGLFEKVHVNSFYGDDWDTGTTESMRYEKTRFIE